MIFGWVVGHYKCYWATTLLQQKVWQTQDLHTNRALKLFTATLAQCQEDKLKPQP